MATSSLLVSIGILFFLLWRFHFCPLLASSYCYGASNYSCYYGVCSCSNRNGVLRESSSSSDKVCMPFDMEHKIGWHDIYTGTGVLCKIWTCVLLFWSSIYRFSVAVFVSNDILVWIKRTSSPAVPGSCLSEPYLTCTCSVVLPTVAEPVTLPTGACKCPRPVLGCILLQCCQSFYLWVKILCVWHWSLDPSSPSWPR